MSLNPKLECDHFLRQMQVCAFFIGLFIIDCILMYYRFSWGYVAATVLTFTAFAMMYSSAIMSADMSIDMDLETIVQKWHNPPAVVWRAWKLHRDRRRV